MAKSSKDPEKTQLSLADAIIDLREQLYKAQQDGHTKQENTLTFEIVDIDLELQLVASLSDKVDGRIGWSVFGLGAGSEAGSVHTHKLHLKLRVTPQADGKPMPISADADESQLGS